MARLATLVSIIEKRNPRPGKDMTY
jgi:hypothetical protein